jgi:hypothetical protein
MSAAHAAVLSFLLCTSPSADYEECEEGTVAARTCAAAEQYMRVAMREHQTLTIWGCTVQAVAR